MTTHLDTLRQVMDGGENINKALKSALFWAGKIPRDTEMNIFERDIRRIKDALGIPVDVRDVGVAHPDMKGEAKKEAKLDYSHVTILIRLTPNNARE